MDQKETLIPHIKAGSIVPVELNLSHINGLYGIYQVLLKGVSKEAVESLKIKIESKQPLQDIEMAVYSISIILQMIHKSAEEHDMVEMKPLDDAMKEAFNNAAKTTP